MLVLYKINHDLTVLFRKFFADLIIRHSDLKERRVYLISPWINNFKFTPPLTIYPIAYVNDIISCIKLLKKLNYEVYILTRCFDDQLIPHKLYNLFVLYNEALKNKSSEIINLLRDTMKEFELILSSIITILELVKYGIKVKFDRRFCKKDSLVNLHVKLYISPLYAIFGSANLTRSGVLSINEYKYANEECILFINRDEKIYNELLNIARKYYKYAINIDECINNTLIRLNKTLSHIIQVRFYNIDDIISYYNLITDRLRKHGLI